MARSRLRRSALACCAMLALAACAVTAQPDSPAVLTNPGPATHEALVKVVSDALHVPTVTIAEDALTRDSLLIIERRPARDAAGQRLNGRETQAPEQFRLVIDDRGRCALVHLGTQQRYGLAAQCKKE